MPKNNTHYNYSYLIDSFEDEDLMYSEDQYLLFCWEPNFTLPVLKTPFKFGKRVSTFVVAGVFFLMPKVSFATNFPKNSSSNNNSKMVVYRDGKPEATMYEANKRDLALAFISQHKDMFIKEKQPLAVVLYNPPKTVVPYNPPKNTKLSMVPIRPESRAMVKGASRIMTKGVRTRWAPWYTFFEDDLYKNSIVSAKRANNMALSLQEMKESMLSEAGIETDFPYVHLIGGLDSSEMSPAQKDQQIRYYRFLSKAVLVVSGTAITLLAIKFAMYAKKCHKTFDKLIAKYMLNKANNLETSKLHNALFSDWKEMVSKYTKVIRKQDAKIKKIQATAANDVATLHLLIEMLTEDRDGLLKQLKFIQEHGNP